MKQLQPQKIKNALKRTIVGVKEESDEYIIELKVLAEEAKNEIKK